MNLDELNAKYGSPTGAPLQSQTGSNILSSFQQERENMRNAKQKTTETEKPAEPNLGEQTGKEMLSGGQKILDSISGGAAQMEKGINPEKPEDLLNIPAGMARAEAGAVAGAGQVIAAPITAGLQKLADATGIHPVDAFWNQKDNPFVDKLKEKMAANPDQTDLIGDILNAVMTFLGAKGLDASTILKTPVSEAVSETGQALKGATGNIISKTGDIVSNAGKATESAAKGVYQSAITPTVKEAEKILAYKAKTPFLERVGNALSGESKAPSTRATTAAEKGIAGTESMLGIQAKRVGQDIWTKELEPALNDSTVQMNKNELFDSIQKRIDQTIEPGKKADYQNALDSIIEDYKDFPDTFSLKEAQKLKEGLAEFTPEKVYRGKNVANEATMLKADMASDIRNKIYDSLGEGTKQKYLDYGNLKELEKVGVRAISSAGTKGGFGSFWSHAWDMATIPVKTVGGKILYRVGNTLEFIGDKGLKSFGEFLQNKGFEQTK